MSILHLYADPKPGVTEAVELLREKGIKIGSTTGYTDKMMEIVVPAAASKGYAPDVWFSPDSTGQKGRPYPYMIFRNMEALGLMDVFEALSPEEREEQCRRTEEKFLAAKRTVKIRLTRTEPGNLKSLPEEQRYIFSFFRQAFLRFIRPILHRTGYLRRYFLQYLLLLSRYRRYLKHREEPVRLLPALR